MSPILDGELEIQNQYEGEMEVQSNYDGELDICPKLDGELVPIWSNDKHYTHEQAQVSDVWIIHHNLHKHPSVSVTDTAKTQVVGDVEYLDFDTVKITFKDPFSGYAYLN